MCEQCMVESVTVAYVGYDDDDRDGWYVGIATKDWTWYEAGDILVGRMNDPEMVFDDLFEAEDWNSDEELPDDHPISRFLFEEEAMNFWHPGRDWWVSIPHAVSSFEQAFGKPPEDWGIWNAWAICVVAGIFREHDVPFDRAGRLQWALENKHEST